MDSLTQAALGATIAEAGFGRRLGPKAVVFGALAGLAPDLDMLARVFVDEWTMLGHHRAITHSLLVLPPAAALAGWLGWRLSARRGTWIAWTHLALWALVTHPLLDWCTTYGTLLFYPLTSHRFAIDAVAILDPIYSLPLFAGLGACLWLDRRHSRERPAEDPAAGSADGRPRAAPRSLWIAAGALAFTTAYLLFGLGLTLRSVSFARGQLEREGFRPVEVRATPYVFAGIVRRIVARDARGEIRVGAMSPLSSRKIAFTRLEPPDDPLVRKAAGSERGRIFTWFAMDMVAARLERRPGGGATVWLDDQRYGFITSPSATPFTARFEFDGAGDLTDAALVHEVDVSLRAEARAGWRLLFGGGDPASGGR